MNILKFSSNLFTSTTKNLSYAFNIAFALILKKLKEIDNYIVKSDDEEIDKLLKNDQDKLTFQMAVDDLLRNNKKTKDIKINKKTVTISID